jgi:hypothetical protein
MEQPCQRAGLPNPCWLMSRELLYTALTRQRQRVVILHQGSRSELRRFASDKWSEAAKRLTNLFRAPEPVEIAGSFYEDNLIHRTCKGEMVRSKSEVIVADRLADMGVKYLYEQPLTIDEVTKYPDFTIEDEETGITFYWEHCGMLGNPDYRTRWDAKKEWYRKNNILPSEEGGGANGTLIVSADGHDGSISSQDIERIIHDTILS